MADINVGAISEALNNKADLDLHNLNNEGKKSVTLAGMVTAFAGTTAPEGWLKCDGSAISRTRYAELFSVIGTGHGTGDGYTTFNLPRQSVLPLGTSAPVVTTSTNHVGGSTPMRLGTVGTSTSVNRGSGNPIGTFGDNGIGSIQAGGKWGSQNDRLNPINLVASLSQATGAKAIVCIKY